MNVYIVIDENRNIEVVCRTENGAKEYIKEELRLGSELNYLMAQVWTDDDVNNNSINNRADAFENRAYIEGNI
jgi:hypothetical protein